MCDFCPSLIEIGMLTNVSRILNMKFHIDLNPSGGNCLFATDWRKGMPRLTGFFFSQLFCECAEKRNEYSFILQSVLRQVQILFQRSCPHSAI